MLPISEKVIVPMTEISSSPIKPIATFKSEVRVNDIESTSLNYKTSYPKIQELKPLSRKVSNVFLRRQSKNLAELQRLVNEVNKRLPPISCRTERKGETSALQPRTSTSTNSSFHGISRQSSVKLKENLMENSMFEVSTCRKTHGVVSQIKGDLSRKLTKVPSKNDPSKKDISKLSRGLSHRSKGLQHIRSLSADLRMIKLSVRRVKSSRAALVFCNREADQKKVKSVASNIITQQIGESIGNKFHRAVLAIAASNRINRIKTLWKW